MIGAGGFVGAVILVAGGYFGWQAHQNAHKKQIKTAAAQTVGDHVISLNQAPAPSDDSGLRVGSSSTGQLVGGGQSSQGSAQSSSNASSQTLDPATFKQYDKYKDSQNGLFGDVQVGSGATLSSGQKAAVYYKGWLTDGTLFDQSKAGSDGKLQPFVFTLGDHQVIPGWEEAISGMKVGGTRLMIVPPAVGYGAQGQGSIPGNAVLVFEVQLLAVQ